MIINTGMRTDIPAFYSEWLCNRLKDGQVMVRNPYYPKTVTRYRLDPSVVDVISFCTKNPQPMLDRLDSLKGFGQYWFVTVTPYGKDIEPNVPGIDDVIDSLKELSECIGKQHVAWRYDPVLIAGDYDLEFHEKMIDEMSYSLSGYVDQCVFSFIDIYDKVARNMPEARALKDDERIGIAKALSSSGKKYGIRIRSCMEGNDLERFGIDVKGCMTKEVLEESIGRRMTIPKRKGPREGCDCALGNDIGAYNSCGHLCKYCYANSDRKRVLENMKLHDPESPVLIGKVESDEEIRDAKQISFITKQMTLDGM